MKGFESRTNRMLGIFACSGWSYCLGVSFEYSSLEMVVRVLTLWTSEVGSALSTLSIVFVNYPIEVNKIDIGGSMVLVFFV